MQFVLYYDSLLAIVVVAAASVLYIGLHVDINPVINHILFHQQAKQHCALQLQYKRDT